MGSPVSTQPSLSSGPVDLSQDRVPKRPIIIGIFGVPGSGKTFLLNQLLDQLGEEHFKFFEGSQVIAGICPGGLDAFKASSEVDKLQWRGRAITRIRDECASSGRAGVVVGHFMFWEGESKPSEPVLTGGDWDTFTHILYLRVPSELVEQRRCGDSQRRRSPVSEYHLSRWQSKEVTELRRLCGGHGVLFRCVSPGPALLDEVISLLHDFRIHDEAYNLAKAIARLDEIFEGRERPETVLVLDGDRTLIAEDTGKLFAERCEETSICTSELLDIFNGPLGYSYTAFRQAMLLYEEVANVRQFKRICYNVASRVNLSRDFLSLLDKAAEEKHVGVVVITCGLGCMWKAILEMHDLHGSVHVIGGGKLADEFVVTAAVRAKLVERLQSFHGARVWAFGDGPLDLPMLRMADEAVVVVRDWGWGSKHIDDALLEAIDNQGLRPRQLDIRSFFDGEPLYDVAKVPLLQLDETTVLDSILRRDIRRPVFKVIHDSDSNSVRMLMTPTRDARTRCPGLREAHRHVGRYLAVRYLSELVGVEEHPIPHVQGHHTSGFRLRDAQQTCIVALMRGGEPMAMGVSDAVPEAMFVHAQTPEDLKSHHLKNQTIVVLVDSVVNSGASVMGFYKQVRSLKAMARIVVVAGVVQAQCVSEGGLLYGLGHDMLFDVVALRLSDNAFTGQGGTDTGNRLFNTTHLPSKR